MDTIIYKGNKDNNLLFSVEISGKQHDVEIPVGPRFIKLFEAYIKELPLYFNGYKTRANVHYLVFSPQNKSVSEKPDDETTFVRKSILEIPLDEITAKSVMATLQRFAPPRSKLVERRNEEE